MKFRGIIYIFIKNNDPVIKAEYVITEKVGNIDFYRLKKIFKPPLEKINESEASSTGISVKEKALY